MQGRLDDPLLAPNGAAGGIGDLTYKPPGMRGRARGLTREGPGCGDGMMPELLREETPPAPNGAAGGRKG